MPRRHSGQRRLYHAAASRWRNGSGRHWICRYEPQQSAGGHREAQDLPACSFLADALQNARALADPCQTLLSPSKIWLQNCAGKGVRTLETAPKASSTGMPMRCLPGRMGSNAETTWSWV